MRRKSVPSIDDGGYRNAAIAVGKVTSALAVGEPDKMVSGSPCVLFSPARIHALDSFCQMLLTLTLCHLPIELSVEGRTEAT
jgi:hypothetical protein